MILIKLSIVLAALFSLSSSQEFIPYARLVMTSKWIDANDQTQIKDSLGGSINAKTSDASNMPSTCGSTPTLTAHFVVDFSGYSPNTDVAISAWYYQNAHGDTSQYPFAFARNADNIQSDYAVRSDASSWSAFFKDATQTGNNQQQNSNNDMVVTDKVGEWVFITFYWTTQGSNIYWKIYSLFDQLSMLGSDPTYVMPTYMDVGTSWDGLIYEIIIHKGSTSTGVANSYVITLLDNQGNSYNAMATNICSPCTGPCHPEYGCLSATGCQCLYACSACDSSGNCQGCKDTIRSTSSNCRNFHLECFLNCDLCKSKTECDHCASNYFLNTDSNSNLRCFCKIYAACETSCTDCISGECYTCADLVVQDGTSCREDSVGFQISFSYPNIVIDFATPLKSALTKDNISGKYQGGAGNNILTNGWSIDSLSTLSKTIVKTDNIQDSDLPISIDFSFNGGA